VNNHSVSIRDVQSNNLAEQGFDAKSYLNDPFHPGFVQYNSYVGAFSDRYSVPGGEVAHLPASDDLAIANLIQNAQAGISGNLAQNLAQINQTVSMITTAASSITKSILALKSGNIPGAVSALARFSNSSRFQKKGSPSLKKSLANNWLALQYGWKPLLSDIEGAMRSLGNAKMNSALGSTFVAQVTGSASAKHVSDSNGPVAFYPTVGPHAVQSTEVTETRTRYGIRYKITDPTVAFLQQTGFTNPLNLAWEILPFSFVVDWFLPIGPFLESLSYSQGLEFVSGFKTRFTRSRVASVVGFGGEIEGSNVTFMTSGTYAEERILLTREVISSFPSRSFPSPRMGINNSTGGVSRALNGIALLTQAFKG